MQLRAMNGAGIAIEFPLPLPRHLRRGRMIADKRPQLATASGGCQPSVH
jgi:hypothetical protein